MHRPSLPFLLHNEFLAMASPWKYFPICLPQNSSIALTGHRANFSLKPCLILNLSISLKALYASGDVMFICIFILYVGIYLYPIHWVPVLMALIFFIHWVYFSYKQAIFHLHPAKSYALLIQWVKKNGEYTGQWLPLGRADKFRMINSIWTVFVGNVFLKWFGKKVKQYHLL